MPCHRPIEYIIIFAFWWSDGFWSGNWLSYVGQVGEQKCFSSSYIIIKKKQQEIEHMCKWGNNRSRWVGNRMNLSPSPNVPPNCNAGKSTFQISVNRVLWGTRWLAVDWYNQRSWSYVALSSGLIAIWWRPCFLSTSLCNIRQWLDQSLPSLLCTVVHQSVQSTFILSFSHLDDVEPRYFMKLTR